MEHGALLDRLAESLPAPNAGRLTAVLTDLIAQGDVAPGVKLPPIRAVAERIGMSPSAVGQAWRALAERGIVSTRTRGGTIVIGPPEPPRPRRYSELVALSDAAAADLGRPRPDLALLPDLRRILHRVADTAPQLNESDPPSITAALREAVAEDWPFPPQRWLAAHRPIDGIEQAMLALISPGDVIAVEDPTIPRILDLVDRAGARSIPVGWTDTGPDPRELARAVRLGATLFIYQPNSQSPTGRSVDDAWLDRARDVLVRGETLVLELDAFPLLHERAVSLGSRLPERTILVRGFAHSHGPDVQTAVLAGPDAAVRRIENAVAYAHRWVSRVLQDALAEMLVDPEVRAAVAAASAEYRSRHAAARDLLVGRGIAVGPSTAPSLWLPVEDEDAVLQDLRERGIAVLPGRSFSRRRGTGPHVHVNGTVPFAANRDTLEEIARAIERTARRVRAERRLRD